MVRKSDVSIVTNARSYGGFITRSDHHPVIADVRLSFKKSNNAPKANHRCFVTYNPPSADTQKQYQRILSESLPVVASPPPSSQGEIDTLWNSFVSTIHGAACTSFGIQPRRAKPTRSKNPTIKQLSQDQKDLHIRIHAEPDPARRKVLKEERNSIQHKIRKILRQDGDDFWQRQAEATDALRPDPRSYYNAIRNLRQMKSNTNTPPVWLADDDGNIMTSIQWNLDTFSKYFQSIFHRPDLPCDFRGSQDRRGFFRRHR